MANLSPQLRTVCLKHDPLDTFFDGLLKVIEVTSKIDIPPLTIKAESASSQYYKDIYGFGGEFIRVMWDTYRENLPTDLKDNWQEAIDSWPPHPTLTVQPNPMAGQVLFVLNDGVDPITTIRIFDNAGNVIIFHIGANGRSPFRWDGTDIAGKPVKPGIYFYHASAGGMTYTGHIVKSY